MTMTRFRTSLLAVALTASGTAIASAQSGTSHTVDSEVALFAQATMTPEEVVSSLTAQGYVVIEQGRTLLGRVMVRAETETHAREVVVHPRTNEVLRDVVTELSVRGRTGLTAETGRDQRIGIQGHGLLGISGNVGAEVGGGVSGGAGTGGAGIGGSGSVGVGGGVGAGVGVGGSGGVGIGGD